MAKEYTENPITLLKGPKDMQNTSLLALFQHCIVSGAQPDLQDKIYNEIISRMKNGMRWRC